ncbi:MAG: hypothetical protein KA285_02920 [Bacteroidia bacterium]|nr:hypothetical protein [Bacteroidia bacterium]
MIRIYLDTNVFNKARTRNEKEFENFWTKLFANSDELLYVYSKAHLLDLLKDKTNNKFADLDFISKLAKDNYMSVEGDDEIMTFQKINARDAFNSQINHDYFDDSPFSSLMNDSIFSENSTLAQLMKIKLPINFPKFEGITDNQISLINKIFPLGKSEISIMDILETFQSFYQEISNKHNPTFKEMRRMSIEALNFQIGNEENVDFDSILKESALKKDLSELVESIISNNKSLKNTRYSFFTTTYLMLNIFGLDNENLRKSNFLSTIHDAQHVFYGAHCDYFVTEESKMALKARGLYKKFNISTRVLTLNQFMNSINTIANNRENKITTFFDLLNYELNNGMVIFRKPSIENNTIYEIIRPIHRFFGYFN